MDELRKIPAAQAYYVVYLVYHLSLPSIFTMKGAGGASGASRSAAERNNGSPAENCEPETKKQRLLTKTCTNAADHPHETDEELYQKAVSLVFGGELYAKLLSYGGPEAIAHFRDDDKWRRAMDELSEADKKALGLPSVPRPSDMDLTLLRGLLTESISSPYAGKGAGWTLNALGRLTLASSPIASCEALEGLIHKDCEDNVLDIIARREGLPVAVLVKLVENNMVRVFGDISMCRNATSEILSAVLLRSCTCGDLLDNIDKEKIARNVAQNKNTGELDLSFLAMDKRSVVRMTVAEKATAKKLLHLLASDSDPYVRAHVAKNEHTPRDVLVRLSMDTASNVRWFLAQNPKAGIEICSVLAKDPDASITTALARNPGVYLDFLLNDEVLRHRSILALYSKDPCTLEMLAGSEEVGIRHSVATNSNTPQTILGLLAGDEDEGVRTAVASHPNTSEDTFTKLFKDNACKAFLANNPKTPSDILDTLANDPDDAVRESVAANSSAPLHTLERILSSGEFDEILYWNKQLPLRALIQAVEKLLRQNKQMSDDMESAFLDRIEYEDVELPLDFVVALSKGRNELLRYGVACEAKLPVVDIIRLSRETFSDIGDINDSLRSNPLLQVAVDKLSRLLSREGFGSPSHFEHEESWW